MSHVVVRKPPIANSPNQIRKSHRSPLPAQLAASLAGQEKATQRGPFFLRIIPNEVFAPYKGSDLTRCSVWAYAVISVSWGSKEVGSGRAPGVLFDG